MPIWSMDLSSIVHINVIGTVATNKISSLLSVALIIIALMLLLVMGIFVLYRGMFKRVQKLKRDNEALKTSLESYKKFEEQLIHISQEQKTLLNLFDNSSSAIIRWKNNKKYSMEYVSASLEAILGYESQSFINETLNFEDVIHQEDLKRVKEEAINVFHNGGIYVKHEPYRLMTKNGETIWVLDQTIVEKNQKDEITNYVTYLIDITKGMKFQIELEKKNSELKDVNEELEISLMELNKISTLYEQERYRYKNVLDLATDGIFLMDIDGHIIEYSKKVMELLGYSESEMGKLEVYDWDKEIKNEDWQKMLEMMSDSPIEIERIHTRKDGSTYVAGITAKMLTISGETYVYAGVRDISPIKKIQKELEENSLRWKFVIEGNNDGLWDWNIKEHTLSISPRWQEVLGYDNREEARWTANELKERIHPDDLEDVEKALTEYIKGNEGQYVHEHRIMKKNGDYIWIRDRGLIIERDEDGKPSRLMGIQTDITDHVRDMEFIRNQTYVDSLTQLHNRKSYNERLKELIEQYRRYGMTFSMMMIDLDYFKDINDQNGHDVGDEVLVTIAQILKERVRINDYVFRIGGEEFVILLSATELEAATKLAEDLRLETERCLRIERLIANKATISIGVTQVIAGDSIESIYKRADQYLYIAKKNGRNQVVSMEL